MPQVKKPNVGDPQIRFALNLHWNSKKEIKKDVKVVAKLYNKSHQLISTVTIHIDKLYNPASDTGETNEFDFNVPFGCKDYNENLPTEFILGVTTSYIDHDPHGGDKPVENPEEISKVWGGGVCVN